MSSVVISGNTSGSVTLSAPDVAGSNTATLPLATGELSMLGGAGQTWQDVTASRAYSTTYTNNTGKPIFVSIRGNGSATIDVGTTITLTISGIAVLSNSSMNRGTAYTTGVNGIVPAGATYSVTANNGSLASWSELR